MTWDVKPLGEGCAGAGAPAQVGSVDDLGGRVDQLLGQGDTLSRSGGAVEVQAQLTAFLRSDAAGGFTLKYPYGDLAGLNAVLVVVDTQGSNGAALDRVGIGGHQRGLGVVADLDQRLVGGDHDVVGAGVGNVHLADQAAGSGAHVNGTRSGGFHQGHAHGRQQLAQTLDHHHGVGFTRVVDHAHAGGVGHYLLDQLHLAIQFQLVGHTGNVGAGGFPAADQLRCQRIGYRSKDHRNGLGAGHHGLGRGGGDGDDHVGLVTHELAGDLAGGGGVALGSLVLPLQVVANGVAG